MAQQSGESGVALVAQASSLADDRKKRINSFRPKEIELIRLTLKVLAIDKYGVAPPAAVPKCEYTEMTEALDVQTMAENDWLLRNKLATPIDLLMRMNPGMTEPEAQARYEKNVAFFKENAPPNPFSAPPPAGDDEKDDAEKNDDAVNAEPAGAGDNGL